MESIRKICSLLIVLVLAVSSLLILFVIPVVDAQIGTNVSSKIINSDTTWTKANSPYTLIGRVGVAKGATLTIESGVTVNLGLFSLEVNGTLIAQGAPNDKIIFNSDYQNINLLYNNPTCMIENAILNQTSINGAGSYSNTPLVTINNCSLEGNAAINVWGSTTISNSYITGAVLLRGASVISGSTFLNGIDIAGGSSGTSSKGTYAVSGSNITNQEGRNVMNVGNSETEVLGAITANVIWGGSVAGICQADGFSSMSATIERNLIINNQIGILMRHNDDSTIQYNTIANNKVGISNPNSLQTITGNNIQDNSQYNMQSGQTMATAKNNWWGTTDQQAINQTIYDSNDDFELGTINFVPFLTSPNPQAPSLNMSIPTSNPSSYPTSTVPEFSWLTILPILLTTTIAFA
jgi:parallel beta-helix repeat protein